QDMVLAANASRLYLSVGRKEILGAADPKKVMLVAEVSEQGKPLGRNIFWFEKTKELDLPNPDLRLEVTPGDRGTFVIQASATKLARDVYLTTASDGFFGDNYFDLLPGETRALSFKPAAPTTLQSIQSSLRATTIADTY